MSIASQQRVIEGHQATIRDLRQQLRQAEADARDALGVADALTLLCDEHEAGRQQAVPVATLRQIRPRGHGLG